MVGQSLAAKLETLGHVVMMGSRTPDNPKAVAWARHAGPRGHAGTFADVATYGDIVFNCHAWRKLDRRVARGWSGEPHGQDRR